jgi:hypothetical protein
MNKPFCVLLFGLKDTCPFEKRTTLLPAASLIINANFLGLFFFFADDESSSSSPWWHWEIDYRKTIGIYRNFDGKLLQSFFTTVSEVFLEKIAPLRPFQRCFGC